jgi:WD40 repeat protein
MRQSDSQDKTLPVEKEREQDIERTIAATLPKEAEEIEAAEADVALEWNIGDVSLDLYEVKGIHKGGGMGLVYRVSHRGWNIDLAVKSPRADYFQTEEQKENFVRECETWINMGLHPHIVSCYYVRTLGGIPRVFAEYVEGGSLSDWIKERKLYEGGHKKALERILDIAIQFAWGLDYAHEKGLIHQDVKPANVMMTPDGTAKVTDFGLAKARGLTGEGAGVVPERSVLVSTGGMTPVYCSPEQANREKLSRKTDIWSWGLSVLEMFTGEVTWMAGQMAAEVLESYIETGVEDEAIPRMPEAMVELLRQCFQRDPVDRPRSMQEIVMRLKESYRQITKVIFGREEPKAAELLADGLNNRAVSFLDLGKQEEAEKLFYSALKSDPLHPESTYNRGLLEWRTGKITDGALAEKMRAVCTSHPGKSIPFYLLAKVNMERGDYKGAVKALEEVDERKIGQRDIAPMLEISKKQLANSRGLLHTLDGHQSAINSVNTDEDGRYVLSGSSDYTTKLWEIESGKCLQTFEGHAWDVNFVSLNTSKGHVISAGSKDMRLKLWDVATGNCMRTFILQNEEDFQCLSADWRYIMTTVGTTLKLWELSLSSFECLRTFNGHADNVNSVSFSIDGRFSLSGSDDKTLRLWDVATGTCIRTFKGHEDGVNSINFSRDGRFALSGSKDKTVKLWDLATGSCIRTFEGHKEDVKSVFLSSNGRYALSGSLDKTLKLWEVATGICQNTFEGHKFGLSSVCLSADGRYAISGDTNGTLKLWIANCDADPYRAPLMISHVLRSETVLSEQREFKIAMEKAQRALQNKNPSDAADYVRLARSKPGYNRAKDAMETWRKLYVHLLRKNLNGAWESDALEGNVSGEGYVFISTEGKFILSDVSKSLKLWDWSRARDQSECVSVDGSYILSGGKDQLIKYTEVETGEERIFDTLEWHTEPVKSISVSFDGRFALSGGADNKIKLWDVVSGKCLRTFEGHKGSVNSVCFSLDGHYALSGSDDCTLMFWETFSGKRLFTMAGSKFPVNSAYLTPDCGVAFSGGRNGLKLWILDWELEEKQPSDWDEGARPFMEMFLRSHRYRYEKMMNESNKLERDTDKSTEFRSNYILTEEDFQELLYLLGCAGYGWLRPDGVRQELEKMTKELKSKFS